MFKVLQLLEMVVHRTNILLHIILQRIYAGVFSLFEENQIPKQEGDVEYKRIKNTTYEVSAFYGGKTTLLDIIKNSLKRDADAVLRDMNNK